MPLPGVLALYTGALAAAAGAGLLYAIGTYALLTQRWGSCM